MFHMGEVDVCACVQRHSSGQFERLSGRQVAV